MIDQVVREAVRNIRRSPGFAFTTGLILALGIGLATAVFTVAETLLVRRLPVVDQDRIVVIWGRKPDGSFENFPIALKQARELEQTTQALQRVAFFGYEGAAPIVLRAGDQTLRLHRAVVSGRYFDVLGTRPLLGRTIRLEDDAVGAKPVAVLSYAAWQRMFGGDSTVIGRSFLPHQGRTTYTIVGVMPQGLDYPRGVDFWATVLASTSQNYLQYVALNVIGRLTAGATPDAAREEMTAHFKRTASVWQRDLLGVVHTLPRIILGDTRSALFAFAAAAGLLLLITCINVANLLLVRGLARVREIAVRQALGASRGRIVRQLLAENSLVAAVGGVIGVVVATVAVRSFVTFAPANLPRLNEIGVNAPALGGAAAITALALAIFAVAPAFTASRIDAQDALRSGTRQSGTRRVRLTSELLVVGQVALAVVVLAAAGLVAKSFVKLQRADLAFDPSRLLIAELALSSERYGTVAKHGALLEEIVPQLLTVPGVRAVSPVVAVPFAGSHGWDGRPAKEGQSAEEAGKNPMLNMEVVPPGYFNMFGISILRGRAFTENDREGSAGVAILSQRAAQRYWPNENPIGKRLYMDENLATQLTVVGIAPDTRYRDLREARPTIYFPLRQSIFPFAPTTLVIRTEGEPTRMVSLVRQLILQRFAGVALAGAAPFDAFLATPLAQPRLNAFLLSLFAGAAIMLAAVGLLGVMMLMVRQRTRELGVRMALGATAAGLRTLVLGRGLTIAAAGLAVGFAGALSANRLLRALLFEVSPTDGTTLAFVAAVVLTVAIVASLIPARVSGRVDPMHALRAED